MGTNRDFSLMRSVGLSAGGATLVPALLSPGKAHTYYQNHPSTAWGCSASSGEAATAPVLPEPHETPAAPKAEGAC